MGIRPNKTNFGLSFGHFGSKNVKKKEEEKNKRKGRRRRRRGKVRNYDFCMEPMFLYGFMTSSMETLSMEVFVWILVVPFLGFS